MSVLDTSTVKEFRELNLILDVSETYVNGLQTGIQQVVRFLANGLARRAKSGIARVQFVVIHPKYARPFFLSSPKELKPKLHKNPGNSVEYERGRSIRQGLRTILGGAVWFLYQTRPVQMLLGRKQASLTAVHQEYLPENVSDMGALSYFLIIDSFWNRGASLRRHLKDVKANGTRIGMLLFDLLPLSHPHFFRRSLVRPFRYHLRSLLSEVDDVFFISQTTKAQFEALFPDHYSASRSVIEVGSTNLLAFRPSRVSKDSSSINKPRILMVGTIEPRKNYGLVLDWWKSTGHDYFELTIIGRPGWKSNTIQNEMVHEHNLDRGFRWLGEVSEEGLIAELGNHQIGLSASFAEGLGLPLLEMASAGLDLVASDIPAHREFARPSSIFFDPNSIGSLDHALHSVPGDQNNVKEYQPGFRRDGLGDLVNELRHLAAHLE